MPIVRTYACPECNSFMEVRLRADEWDAPPPPCPRCTARLRQQFRPIATVRPEGSARDGANKFVEDVISNDYGVANIFRDRHEGAKPKVQYKDQGTPAQAATWGVANGVLQNAIAAGRESRLKYGSGLDVLQANLKSGIEPDLIEASKRRSPRIW